MKRTICLSAALSFWTLAMLAVDAAVDSVVLGDPWRLA